MSKNARLGALFVLVLAPLALRLWPIAHGYPRNYVPDTHVVKNALGMLKDKDLVPPVGKYSSYPYFVPYMLLPIYVGEYAVGRAVGAWHSSDEFKLRALEDPAIVQIPARVLIALFGAASAWAAFRAARSLGLERGAWVSAFLVATSLLHVQLSLHERPWIPVVFFGLLAIPPSVAFAREARTRDLIVSGLFAALAFACHQSGLVFLGVPALAWAFSASGWSGEALRRRLVAGVACVASFVALALVVGHPYYLRYGAVAQAQVVGGDQAAGELSVGGQAVRFGVSWPSVQHLAVSFFAYDPLLVVLGLAGACIALRSRTWRPLLVFTATATAFFLTNPSDHIRYLLPSAALFALPAGLAAERMLARRATSFVLGLALLVPLIQAARMDLVLRRADTRADAELELARLPSGARVAIDHYGPAVDLDRGALERLATLRELRTREASRLELLKAGLLPPDRLGVDALFVEDLCEVDAATGEYGVRAELKKLGAKPVELFRALGITHLLLVDRGEHGADGSRLEELARGAKELWRVEPANDGSAPSEAFLPTEMRFPLTALWRVDRPGPRMQLVELR